MRNWGIAVYVLAFACSSPESIEREVTPGPDTLGEASVGTELVFSDVLVPDLVPDPGPELPDVRPETTPDVPGELPLEVAAELPDLWSETETTAGFCGDEECLGDEYCDTCPVDCGECTVCGNGECEPGQPLESPGTCAVDCGGCGDGICSINELEEDGFCHSDCGYACGDGVCNETEQAFDEEDADYCPVDCGGCYDGVCGYQDLTNPELADCMLADCSTLCGNGICASGETWDECPVDCPVCGDGVCGKVGKEWESCPLDCDKPCGDGLCEGSETAEECPADCGPCGDGICSIAEAKYGGCVADCPDTCGNKHCDGIENEDTCPSDCACKPECNEEWECGEDDNGCGESCGGCPEGSPCIEHVCCVPDCKQKECGEDGCGGDCGGCGGAENAVCVNYSCECVPDCADKECGADGCLGSCGECDDGLFCTDDQCWAGGCHAPLVPGFCLLALAGGFACAEDGALNPDNLCEICDEAAASEVWSPRSDGAPCGPGMSCFEGTCCDWEANCQGRECGDNGCGGWCGQCPDGEKCWKGWCIAQDCVPDCSGKECGSDGCGGSCGGCDDGLFCTTDSCVAAKCSQVLDAGFCVVNMGQGQPMSACAPEGAENPDGPCQVCAPALNQESWSPVADATPCGNEMVCASGSCVPLVCTSDCVGKACGDDGCGGNCGDCMLPEECVGGQCVCQPDCAGKECGDDGCGGECGQCGAGEQCDNGSCELSCVNECPSDGFSECLNADVLQVCGYAPSQCLEWTEQSCANGCASGACLGCTPDCAGKSCGDDGCGGSCGDCAVGWECANGFCQFVSLTCEQYKECLDLCDPGDEDCTNTCKGLSSPAAMQQLDDYRACIKSFCGEVPLPGCESMTQTTFCKSEWDACQEGCQPDCAGKACGDNGCGGSCGECTPPDECVAGQCLCQPDCAGKACGDDGCGGSCGECPGGTFCTGDTFLCKAVGDSCEGMCGQTGASCNCDLACFTFADCCADVCTYCGLEAGFVDHCGGCQPDCAGKECGDDGCGGDCGSCTPPEECVAGACVDNSLCNDGNGIDWDGCTGGVPSEFRVNTTLVERQEHPHVAAFSFGGFIVVYDDLSAGGGGKSVRGQRFGADGLKLGTELELFGAEEHQQWPKVAVLADDSFVVVRMANDTNGSQDVKAQRFAFDGTEVQEEFRVNNTWSGLQSGGYPYSLPDGGFDVVWHGLGHAGDLYQVYFRRYTADGSTFGGDIVVNSYEDGWQKDPRGALFPGGEAVVVFDGPYAGVGSSSADYRLVNAGGTFVAPAGHLAKTTTGTQARVSCAVLDGDTFVGVWETNAIFQDSDGWGIYARRMGTDGQPESDDFGINTHIGGDQRRPVVAAAADVGFVVFWEGENSSDGAGISGQRYDAAWEMAGEQFSPNLSMENEQSHVEVAALSDGFVAVWQSESQGEDATGVFARRYMWDGTECEPGTCLTGGEAACPQGCWDGDVCTDDGCDPVQGCLNEAINCDDGNTCTTDSCDSDQGCQHVPVSCGDNNACNGHEFCDPQQGCQPGQPLDCDDGNPCTDDSCSPLTGCVNMPVADGTDCGGGKVCITSQCVVPPPGCPDYNTIDWDGCKDGVPVEFQVNSYSDGDERRPAVAVLQDGGFAAVWQVMGLDEESWGIFARVFDNTGAPAGPEFQVNATGAGQQRYPSIATLTDGRFVVVWDGNGDGDGAGAFASILDADGQLSIAEFRLNTVPGSTQLLAAVAELPGGSFHAVWTGTDAMGFGIRARKFNGGGAPSAAETQVNQFSGGDQFAPRIERLVNGNEVVTWYHVAEATMAQDAYYAILDGNTGGPLTELALSDDPGGDETLPAPAALTGGGFVVAWVDALADGSDDAIVAQVYDENGIKVGNEFLVNQTTDFEQGFPYALGLAGGGFIVVWADDQDGAFMRRFEADGTPETGEMKLGAHTGTDGQFLARAAAFTDGGWVAVWETMDQDGDGYGIFALRFKNDGSICERHTCETE